jgi:hypothetical protein
VGICPCTHTHTHTQTHTHTHTQVRQAGAGRGVGLGIRSLSRQSAFFGQLRSLLEQETAWIDSPAHTGVCAREGGRERGWEGERVGG